ncbi:glycine--tRNA ligase, partial [Patescibacteria group bacterium]|nr:glycine--tRNA ligase [Patescibacteria group bacterium]
QSSGADLAFVDPNTQQKYVPHVIEPTFGVDRTLLAILISSYIVEDTVASDGTTDSRIVMKLPKHLAPIKIAVLPLSKKPELEDIALPLAEKLAKRFNTEYDFTQSIGKRYRRQDEIGTPYCVTVDFDSASDHAVTVRDRDTMKQERIAIADLETYFETKFSE